MGKIDNSGKEDMRNSGNLSENPVFQPIEVTLRGESQAGKRHRRIEENLSARKAYLKELRSDIEEITQAITRTDDFNEMRSLLGTKYAIERTLLAEERNVLAEERNLLGEERTRASVKRTELSEKRSGLSGIRTSLSKRRSFLSEKRTLMAQQRTLLAKARTELAFIRTGVAFAALATVSCGISDSAGQIASVGQPRTNDWQTTNRPGHSTGTRPRIAGRLPFPATAKRRWPAVTGLADR